MGKLANISGREAVKAFQKAGWQQLGQVGSHLVLVKPGVRVNLSIPLHKESLGWNTPTTHPKCWVDCRRIPGSGLRVSALENITMPKPHFSRALLVSLALATCISFSTRVLAQRRDAFRVDYTVRVASIEDQLFHVTAD